MAHTGYGLMKFVKRSETIRMLYADFRCWQRFLAATRDRGLITRAVDLLAAGKGDRLVTDTMTAYQLAEPEAEAWLRYFRGIGAIATAPAGESEAVRNKSQTTEA